VLAIFALNSSCMSQQQQPDTKNCDELQEQITLLQSKSQDWAGINRYHEANLKVNAPAKTDRRVVFLGDSITDFWDDPGFGGFFPGEPFINRGISSQVTAQMLARFYADVIALKPKAVVILAGTNDIGKDAPLETIENNLAAMAEMAKLYNVKVIMASVTPVKEDPQNLFNRPPKKIADLNKWIKDYAARNKFIYLDYYSTLADERGYMKTGISDDGLHPNYKGYALMNPLVLNAVNAAMGTTSK